MLVPLLGISQQQFKITPKGLNTNSIVIEIDSLNASQLYYKTINWIKDTYNSPDEVIKAKFENEKIRFQGISTNSYTYYVLGSKVSNDVRYMIEISFKDERYKFELISLEAYFSPTQYTSGGWQVIGFEFWKPNGKIKKIFRDTPQDMENMLNHLLISHNNYLIGDVNSKKDDW
jgi:hypothetical protein